MQLYTNSIQDRFGNALQGAQITVRTSAGVLAAIFADNGVTLAANPLTADATGEFAFYAANGRYTFTVTASGMQAEIVSAFEMQDALELQAAVASGVTTTTANRTQTGLDRVQTGLDKVATAADRVVTTQDKAATAADRVQTVLDRAQTALDRTAASGSAGGSASSASASLTSANNSAASATTAGTNAAASANAQIAPSLAAAAASAAAALATRTAIDHRYRGALSADPATRTDGTANVVGDEVFNSTAGLLKRWNGAVWLASDLNTANLAASGGAGLVGFISDGVASVARTMLSKTRERLSVKDFGAVGDGVTDDTVAVQKALNAVPNGGALYFPKTGGASFGPSYKITAGLTLAKNDVTLHSDPSAEYTEGLFTNNAITMLLVTGFGLRMEHLQFVGNGDTLVFGTTNGVVIDRTSLGDAEINSNLDCIAFNCFFFRLNDAFWGKGRNVWIGTSTFSECKRSVVGELHTYGAGLVSDFRGWRITNNRFHGCGGQYINAASTVPVPANLATLDSWCIQMPTTSGATSHLEIANNNADFCGAGFYKGYLAGAKITDNQTHGGTAIFVYAFITDAANQENCSNYINSITGNTINSRTADEVTDRGHQFSLNSIVAFGVSNLVVSRNGMHNSAQSHMLMTACTRLTVDDNTCSNGNMLFASDAVQRPCIVIDQSANASAMNNKVWSTLAGKAYSSGILATTTSNIKFRDNPILNAVIPITVNASDLGKPDCDGLAWVLPAMQNSYVTGAQSQGLRRLFDGTVLVDMHLTAGLDNLVAFQLPAGYRPALAKSYPAVALFTDGSDAYAFVEANGNVTINWQGPAAAGYHLRCSFEAA